MWWRLSRAAFNSGRGEPNRQALRALVESSRPPGLLAYLDGRAVGWCAVAPREEYASLERSRTLRRVDDQPVWSITCFFVHRTARRRGVMAALIRTAVDFAASRGARIVEAYPVDPVDPTKGDYPDPWAFTGMAAAFQEAGFQEAARWKESRPVMRYTCS
jgi:GNAT superfamily N-acetyltransferase